MRSLAAVLFCLCLSLGSASALRGQCNGDPDLCTRRYDEVCYVTTHNAFNYQGAFLFPNQSFDLQRQLQDGVRGFMLDVYWYNSQPTVYHGSQWLGNQPLQPLLGTIKTFLDSNSTEVVTIIFECYITAQQMADVFTQAGLLPYLHTQQAGQPWPTLGDMIAAGKRLVVFTDVNDGQAFPWYHYVWDHAVETHYTAYSRADFSCAFNRGDSSNALFILNHFITQQTLGYGLLDSAAAVNANPYLTSRAMGCWAATGKMPNFLTVDFYEQGDVVATKDAINAGLVSVADPALGTASQLQIGPNPTAGTLTVRSHGDTHGQLILRDALGQAVWTSDWRGPLTQLELPFSLADGLYTVLLRAGTTTVVRKLVVQH